MNNKQRVKVILFAIKKTNPIVEGYSLYHKNSINRFICPIDTIRKYAEGEKIEHVELWWQSHAVFTLGSEANLGFAHLAFALSYSLAMLYASKEASIKFYDKAIEGFIKAYAFGLPYKGNETIENRLSCIRKEIEEYTEKVIKEEQCLNQK